MFLVEMGNDCGLDVADRATELVQSRSEGLPRADVEPGQRRQEAGRSTGE